MRCSGWFFYAFFYKNYSTKRKKNIIESVVLDDVYDVAVVQAVDSASGCEVADNSADSSKTKEPSDLKSGKETTF